jgi:hypothetical protein
LPPTKIRPLAQTTDKNHDPLYLAQDCEKATPVISRLHSSPSGLTAIQEMMDCKIAKAAKTNTDNLKKTRILRKQNQPAKQRAARLIQTPGPMVQEQASAENGLAAKSEVKLGRIATRQDAEPPFSKDHPENRPGGR